VTQAVHGDCRADTVVATCNRVESRVTLSRSLRFLRLSTLRRGGYRVERRVGADVVRAWQENAGRRTVFVVLPTKGTTGRTSPVNGARDRHAFNVVPGFCRRIRARDPRAWPCC